MSYPVMLFGAVVSALIAAVLAALIADRRRRLSLMFATAISGLVGPLTWNSVLRTTGATGSFSHDLPFKPFPISWQDTGSGAFTLAVAFLVLSFTVAAGERARRVAGIAVTTALAALTVDVYLY